MHNVISYVRVSTPSQGDYGNSLNVQTRRIEVFCKANDLMIGKRFEDDWHGPR